MTIECDAVVIGAGHNGLVAANLLADAGWDVIVLEATPAVGGAVRSDAELAPGFVTDRFSSFYPMTAASPVMQGLHLEDHGLAWTHAPSVLAHLRVDAPAAVLHRDVDRTAAGIDLDHPGDGEAWLALAEEWNRYGPAIIDALLAPFPPVRPALRLANAARLDLWDLVRRLILPVGTFSSELFGGDQAALLLAGNALHADVTPESPPSGLLGWILVGLGQTVGFPVPIGGAGRITEALHARLVAAGGAVHVGEPVERIEVRGGRAVGVRTAAGTYAARHGVLAACDAQILYGGLLGEDDLPSAFLGRMQQFGRASGTIKLNYALSSPVPWADPSATGAGTVHIGDSLGELTMTAAQLATHRLPSDPFLLIGQTTTTDASRSPDGTEALWVYTHVPQDARGDAAGAIEVSGRVRGSALAAMVDRMEDRIERHAPGFRSTIVAREVQGPDDMERENPSLVGGDISGGTSQLHQQLIFRPVPGLGRSETPVTSLYLASSSAHPGGSVHGACGANAARAAMLGRKLGSARRLVVGSAAAAAVAGISARRRRRSR